jgi:hypothetical protein
LAEGSLKDIVRRLGVAVGKIRDRLEGSAMSVTDVESAITQLSPKELAELLAWLKEYEEKVWDNKIEEDLEVGRLNDLLAPVGKGK